MKGLFKEHRETLMKIDNAEYDEIEAEFELISNLTGGFCLGWSNN